MQENKNTKEITWNWLLIYEIYLTMDPWISKKNVTKQEKKKKKKEELVANVKLPLSVPTSIFRSTAPVIGSYQFLAINEYVRSQRTVYNILSAQVMVFFCGIYYTTWSLSNPDSTYLTAAINPFVYDKIESHEKQQVCCDRC